MGGGVFEQPGQLGGGEAGVERQQDCAVTGDGVNRDGVGGAVVGEEGDEVAGADAIGVKTLPGRLDAGVEPCRAVTR